MKVYQIKSMYRETILIFKLSAKNLSDALVKGRKQARDTYIEAFGSVLHSELGGIKIKVLELEKEEY